MSLKINPSIGIYDLSFKAAIKSLIKDGFISPELIDNLYTKRAGYYTDNKGMLMEEAKAKLYSVCKPWVLLCNTGHCTCVKLEACGTDDKGEVLYTCKGATRTSQNNSGWYGKGTLENIRSFCNKHYDNKPFVSVCHRNSEGVLELVGYVV